MKVSQIGGIWCAQRASRPSRLEVEAGSGPCIMASYRVVIRPSRLPFALRFHNAIHRLSYALDCQILTDARDAVAGGQATIEAAWRVSAVQVMMRPAGGARGARLIAGSCDKTGPQLSCMCDDML